MIEVLKQALNVIEAAIKAGDWKVDGACDPDNVIHGLRQAIAELESQEPVIDKSAATRIATSLGWSPQRTWVGLTDEEMMDAIYVDDTPMERGRRVEAKLKEKNT
jgi:hypothetical protein